MAETYDYIIVGAGASGSVLAARLAEDSNASVLVLEAGGSDRHPALRLPGLGFAAGTLKSKTWNFVTEPNPAIDGRQVTLLAGRVLGGSGSLNGMVYARGHSSGYDRWAGAGCTGWGFEDVLPWFRRSESNFRGASRLHGADGPMPLRQARPDLPICDSFLMAAAASGIPVVADLNEDHSEGFGFYDVNIHRGLRQSSARTHLRPATSRPNLHVRLRAEVTRICFTGDRASGVEIGTTRIHARQEVILCAGAIMSAKLLLLSGIGPEEELRRHGIRPVALSPKVGKNLQNHPCYRPRISCMDPVSARHHLTPYGLTRAAYQWLSRGEGLLSESFASVGGFFKSDPDLAIADMQVVFLSALPPGGATGLWGLIPREEGFGLTIYQGTPASRGEVGLRGADPRLAPRIETAAFRDPGDLQILARGVARIRALLQQPEIARHIRAEIAPGAAVTTHDDLVAEIRRNAATSYHQCGTCAIGPGPEDVVAPDLQVRGVSGLRVADTSVIPVLPNAALHAVALMIGERAAGFILGASPTP